MRRSNAVAPHGVIVRWALASVPIITLILGPFFLIGAHLDAWSASLLGQQVAAPLAFGSVVLLLVADVLLPIPSSLVSTLAGALLGWPVGTLASWLGMTLGSVVAYALGAFAGRPVLSRLVGADSIEALQRDLGRFGVVLIALGRAVPVLAEATTMIAGASRMPFARFFTVAAIANFGVSLAYATVGALSAQVGSFLLAVTGSMILPALAWWIASRYRARQDFRR